MSVVERSPHLGHAGQLGLLAVLRNHIAVGVKGVAYANGEGDVALRSLVPLIPLIRTSA